MKSTLLFALLFSISFFGFAQMNIVTGIVYNENNNTLPDANVIIKNSTKGKTTNAQGTFTLDVKPSDTLVISYLGFKTKEVVVGDQKEIKIHLKTQFESLDTAIIIAEDYSTISCSCGYTITYIEEFHHPSASLFPNPSVNGLFQLQLDKTYDSITVEIFNMNGQLIQTNTHSKLSKIPKIDISRQPKGIYLIRTIIDGIVLETKKAIRS